MKPRGSALVGLGPLTAESGLLQVFRQTGAPWINPHVTTEADGIAMFYFGWDETRIGDVTYNPKYYINVSATPPYASFVRIFGELELVVDLANVFSGRLPSFKKPSSIVSSLLKSYLRFIRRRIPLPQSLGFKSGLLSPQLYGLIGVMQVRI
jgi:hypothetical protein